MVKITTPTRIITNGTRTPITIVSVLLSDTGTSVVGITVGKRTARARETQRERERERESGRGNSNNVHIYISKVAY